jgi:hypothetical protein
MSGEPMNVAVPRSMRKRRLRKVYWPRSVAIVPFSVRAPIRWSTSMFRSPWL